jgi:glycosyltransferase involved in cell wall biosynthesis
MKANQTLHIVCFHNPYPPVYGGVIDVYYKLKALHALGIQVHFHCFIDESKPDLTALHRLCEAVYIYPRKFKFFKLFSRFPFSVVSRYSPQLYKNLEAVDAPILCEGLQSSFVLHQHDFPNRMKLLRLHNIESNYYTGLAKSETRFWKRLLFVREAKKYAAYQAVLGKFDRVFTLSHFEQDYVQTHFGNGTYVPVFHGNSRFAALADFGDFAFYHGDLRMSDNRKAVAFLVDVFAKIPNYNLIIASSKAASYVQKLIKDIPSITYVPLKTQNQLDTLLSSAQVNVMLSFQQSGTKLKTINSLFKSRHCVVNENMVDDPEILALCTVASTPEEFKSAIEELRFVDFTPEIQEQRQQVAETLLSDEKNAQKIIDCLES